MISTFYNYFRSSAAYRVRIALALKEITPDRIVDIDLRDGEQSAPRYRDHVPAGLVPAFEIGTDGHFGQSLALMRWLDSIAPDPKLIPDDPIEKLKAEEIAFGIACDIHPLNNLRVLKYLTGPMGLSDAQKNQWYSHWVHEGFSGIDTLIERHQGEGRFCIGESVSIADVCLIPQVYNARRFDVDLGSYPHIRAVYEHCNTLTAFQIAAPEQA